MTSGTVSGGCLCGTVRFEIDLPTLFCAHCHCTMCRRAHGAAFVTWVGVPNARFRLISGAEHLRRYDSSAAAHRSFCDLCGTTLLFAGERWAGETHVTRVAIQGEIDREPQAHVYWDERVGWLSVHDELRKLGGPTGVEPLSPE